VGVVGAVDAAAGSDGASGWFRRWCRCLRSMDGMVVGIYLLCEGGRMDCVKKVFDGKKIAMVMEEK